MQPGVRTRERSTLALAKQHQQPTITEPNRPTLTKRKGLDMTRKERWAVGLIVTVVTTAAFAAETITYKYDARGRLVRVERTGSVNNNVNTNYTIDKADNRTNKTTTGSANPPPP